MALASSSNPEIVPAAPLPLEVLTLALLCTSCSFKLWLFYYAPGQINALPLPQHDPSSLYFATSMVEVSFLTVYLSLPYGYSLLPFNL